MKKQQTIWLEFGICALIWGLVPIGIKLVEANFFCIGSIRLALGLICFIALPGTLKQALKIQLKDLIPLFSLGLAFFLHWSTYFYSVQTSSPNIAVLGLSTYGIHLMLLSILFQGRRPSRTDALALVFSLAGAWTIIPQGGLATSTLEGLIYGILGGFFFAVLPIIHQANQHIDHSVRAFYMLFFAFLLFLLCTAFYGWDANPSDWKWYLFLGVIGTFVSHNLWTRVSTYFPAQLTSILYYLYMPITMLWSYLILSEAPGYHKVLGAMLIFIGGILSINRPEKRV